MKRFPLLLITLALTSTPTPTQNLPGEEPQRDPGVQAAFESWRESAGPAWRLRFDPQTSHARLLFGGSLEAPFEPRTDADYVRLAREFAARTRAMHGVRPATLAAGRGIFLPLGLAGSSDKFAVEFEQWVGEARVRGGALNVLLGLGGELLSVDSTGLPGLEDFDPRPDVTPRTAERLARGWLLAETGFEATRVSEPTLYIARALKGKRAVPTLVWEVKTLAEGRTATPRGATWLIAARGVPQLVAREELVHQADVHGHVEARATPGLLPDTAGNPPVSTPMAHMRVDSTAGSVVTDANGDFTFVGVSAPLSVTLQFEGTFSDVNNAQGSDHTESFVLQPGVPNNLVLNSNPTEFVTAQANAFLHTGKLRDWIRSVNPSDATADLLVPANVNIYDACNAVFDGFSVNFYNAYDPCPNTAFSTVVQHEIGHWLNQLYGSSNGPDGFGEGNADVFAMYANDEAVVGQDFFGGGTDIRSGWNTRPFCGVGNEGCYGEVHDDGEVLMGALWKVRARLKTSLGDAQGGLTADLLFNGWLNAYNDYAIQTIIEDHWLTLDDDDGNINNGTPHFADIDGGFLDQGFPGFSPSYVKFEQVTDLQDTLDDIGPYGVRADLSPLLGAGVSSATLHWSVSGGGYQPAPMALHAGSTWTALIPGQSSPNVVRWYLEAKNDLGQTEHLPKQAPAETFAFHIGGQQFFFFDDFESSGDNGWTHAQVAEQDDWQRDVPAGQSGSDQGVSWSDPSSVPSGTRCWGNDLGLSGWNGAYKADVENYLRSPDIDCSAAVGTRLVFERWLTVEQGIFDQADILVNGNLAWTNPKLGNILDSAWTSAVLDISSWADGDPTVSLEWRLRTDGGLELGGWNIDDVGLMTLIPTPTPCPPTSYGPAVGGTFGVPTLDSGGQSPQVGNAGFEVVLRNAPPETQAIFVIGVAPVSVPLLGGELLVLPALLLNTSTDVFGQARLPAPLPNKPAQAGASLYFQAFAIDYGAPEFLVATSGLQAQICP